MAEAHSAVAFSFTITHEGVNINYDKEVLLLVWQSGVRSWKKRFAKFLNNVRNGVFPSSYRSFFLIMSMVTAFTLAEKDVSYGVVKGVSTILPGRETHILVPVLLACALFSLVVFVAISLMLRYTLKLLFMYKGWMYESRGGKGTSLKSKMWIVLVKMMQGRNPLLFSYQGSLPRLPLPSLQETMDRYLVSVRPLLDDDKYSRMLKLAEEFQYGIGKKLQRYLWLKSWWATNYVSDWWEEYVYLRGRSPLMVNSNFYGIDAILVDTTKNQAARAGNLIYASFLYRRGIDSQQMKPIMVQNTVPLCSWQYERQFNTTRVPGVESDKLAHCYDSQHVVVYHKGRYFKLNTYHKHKLLMPCDIQKQIERILQDDSLPQEGEEHLAALTTADRVTWATTRSNCFIKGINKVSLDTIEKAAFVVVLDTEDYEYDPAYPEKLNHYGRSMLHGKGYDRWFDKSFNLIIGKNGRVGFNAEHSWADAPIMGHYWEYCLAHDFFILKYKEDGSTLGTPKNDLPHPVRLKWDLSPECIGQIESCVISANALLEDVDLYLLTHTAYGKGFMKKCKVSPDAFIQMCLQLAYFRDASKFSLTYEASMTRFFREGRTETVRPVTTYACDWVRSMLNPNATATEKKEKLRKACNYHQKGYQDAMCGKGIDRHLFCLYVVSKYLAVDSPFLKEVLSEPWRLSTSQTPHNQTNLLDLNKHPNFISAGGGFGPVADDGYGVSYIIAGEDTLFYHVSSKKSSPETDSYRFARHISQALADMKQLFE